MDRFFDDLFVGLSSGSVYALLALGLVVIYRGTGHLNFAQGEMATLSTYIAWIANDAGVPLVLATLIGMAFGFVLGAATEITLDPAAREEVAAGRVRRHDRPVPRHQRVHDRDLGRAARRGAGQPVPQRPRRLRAPTVGTHLALREHRHLR